MAFQPIKTFRALRAIKRLVKNPAELGEVFRLVDAIESPELEKTFVQDFANDPAMQRALVERPRIGRVDVAELRALPEGTLGREFADFLTSNALDPEDIEVNEVHSAFDYIRAHLRETHDVWHVATGMGTDVAGELGLQAFYYAQFRAPLAVMLLTVGLLNTFFYEMDDRDRRMRQIVRGYLMGKRARSLVGYRWAERWATPLGEVRRELGIEPEHVDEAIESVIGPEAVSVLRVAA